MILNKSNENSIKFKEKIPMILKACIIIPAFLITMPFLLIVFMNSANFWFLPFALGWCTLVFVMIIHRFNLTTNVILSDEMVIAPNRGYHRHFSDVSGTVIIRNGRILIPYRELLEITVKEKIIYLTCRGLSNDVVLHPADMKNFILVLNEKLLEAGINVPINMKDNEPDENSILKFRNNVLTNKPTIIIFIIIFAFPNITGIFSIAAGGLIDGLIFTIITAIVTIIFFIAILMYKVTIILSDDKVIISSKIGDVDLGENKIFYRNIVKIRKTKWRVDIKTKANGYIYFVPANKEIFYTQLQKKVNESKTREVYNLE